MNKPQNKALTAALKQFPTIDPAIAEYFFQTGLDYARSNEDASFDQECGYAEETGAPVCPECGSESYTLVQGDHGCRCDDCDATFICP